MLIETVLKIIIQRPTCKTCIRPSSIQTIEAFGCNVSKRTWIFKSSFRNLTSPLCSKEITAFLTHSEQCLFPSSQNDFYFTNLSRLVLEIFRFCEYHAQNLNTLQKNSACWDLQLGFNSAFKRLMIWNIIVNHTCTNLSDMWEYDILCFATSCSLSLDSLSIMIKSSKKWTCSLWNEMFCCEIMCKTAL